MEKVLITGANGLLGSNIVRQLNTQGYLAKAMVRKGSDKRSLRGAEFSLFEGEITNKEDVFEAVSNCDYVIHSAARTTQTPSHLEAYTETNIEATKLLIEACKHFNIKRFIFVSTANCFTNGSIENPGTENSEFMPWLKGSGYAFSKYLAQKEVLCQFKEYAFPTIVVNPTFMIGPYDSKPSSGSLLLYAYKNKVVFYPSGGKSFVDVEYAAKAVVNSLTKGKLGEAYLLSGKNMTYKNFFKLVQKQSEKRKILIPIPFVLLSTIGKIASLLEDIFSLSLPLNTVNARMLSLDNYFSNQKAIDELALENTNIEGAVSKAVDWFKQNEYLKT
jgi:dihydroflavonol-4-reductase